MDDHKDGVGRETPCRTALRVLLVACLVLHAAAEASVPRRHFDLEPGEATATLDEFGRQAGLQVVFNFTLLSGTRTQAVNGDLEPRGALKRMLRGTNLTFEFVNPRTLIVMPRRQSLVARIWERWKDRPRRPVSPEEQDLEQVLISGLRETGTLPLIGGQTLKLDRVDIDRSGAATPQDFLKTLPQVFGGGPTADTTAGREALSNSARGSGVNLRGLNAGATLVLIDGRRIAPSGTAGAFQDISTIPLSIIDHIDVLPDGASAKYGSDAVGGVVNFVTRTNFSGAQTQVRFGSVTRGSMQERQVSQLFGRLRDNGSDFISFEFFQRDALRAHDRWQYTSDLTPYGGSNFDEPYGTPGSLTDGMRFWPLSTPGAPLVQGAPNLYDQFGGSDITPRETLLSVFTKETLTIGDDTSLHGEALLARRKVSITQGAGFPLLLLVPESNPFYVNPTGIPGPVSVISGTSGYFGPPEADNRVDIGNITLGATTSLDRGWTASGYVAYAFERQNQVSHGHFDQTTLDAALADANPATAFNPFGDASVNNPATLASIAGNGLYDSLSGLRTASVTAVGPILPLPAGEIETTVGAEYRYETIKTTTLLPATPPAESGTLSRGVASEFLELQIPLLGVNDGMAWMHRLTLSAGVRHDGYSDVGSATVPKLGLLWALNGGLNLHGTWTRSFRPPNLTDLIGKNSYSQILPLPDASSATALTNVLLRYGTNTSLRPERARTWTIGADWSPPPLPGLSLSVTYFNIAYSGRIDEAAISPDVLNQPQFIWLVDRNVTTAALTDACTRSTFQGDAASCLTTPVGAIVDNRLRNAGILNTRGLDLIGKYARDSAVGRFELGLNATWLLNYSRADTPTNAPVDFLSTPTNPIDLRARGSVSWARHGLGVTSFVNFENAYRDTLSIPNRGVSPWTTVDLQLAYATGGASWLGQTQLILNAQNLFDVHPPFLNNSLEGLGYDQENADLNGRTLSVEFRKRW